ncbi:MAG: lysylphosphatidylglycerol synthase domain-containing protein [Rhodospirillales bacterium]|nr:lysylphosphatidylglycerol synthase domain-containing protein [Rhodospirillales bacterium]
MTAPVPAPCLPRQSSAAGWSIAITALAVGGAALAAVSAGSSVANVGGALRALWILPGLVGLHLTQLLLAGLGWRSLFTGTRASVAVFYRLRVIREGIDSLLPVAQIGGEIVGARLLARHQVAPGEAGASVIVDVTIELMTQILFLLAGLAALAWLSQQAPWGIWLEAALAGGAAAGLLLAQRFGLLRALDALLRRIAQRWPALAGASPGRLHAAALGFYRHPGAILRSVLLHVVAWALGTAETWAVLHVLGVPVSPLQALVVESLGMAARSAGFAIPAALGVQEGGFVLAALAAGVPATAALPLVLIKRVREVSVGLIGIAHWRVRLRYPAA